MDETMHRILDMLSRNLGRPMSIHELTSKMEQTYGSAYYANIHEKIQEMAQDLLITLSRSGRSSIISPYFENYLLIDFFAEMELIRKQDFLKGRQEMQMLMMEIHTFMHNIPFIKSISLMSPERNSKLNKAEIMFHLKSSNKKSSEEAKIEISAIMANLQRMHNIRIDYLILEDETFLDLLRSNESNPVREMLHNKITILYPQSFWMSIRGEILRGTTIVTEESETHPAKISEENLVFNLARFGYTEFGPKLEQGRPICMEYIISAIMFHKDARRMDAIPIILAKNSKKTSYDLLLFLARRYDFEGKILGILKALRNLVAHGMANVDESIRLLEAMKIEEVKANAKSMKEKLRLYNVT
ncbi:hypothetical protein NITUZ_140232 [Candidatus Nitrosotenuis uzonensis]|uniref:Uncharacterized protein n=2 Tax=Candidatus Nitrosotenuis uzonensis TaxID=1407055 RepID=V6ARA6_9ARCH|nr:hypothetical protein NITUZ_140232 [Candidatus Nitrosotenuis uzonensis]